MQKKRQQAKADAKEKPEWKKRGPKKRDPRKLKVGAAAPDDVRKDELQDLVGRQNSEIARLNEKLDGAYAQVQELQRQLAERDEQAGRDLRAKDLKIHRLRDEIDKLIQKLRRCETKSRNRAEWITDRVLEDEDQDSES